MNANNKLKRYSLFKVFLTIVDTIDLEKDDYQIIIHLAAEDFEDAIIKAKIICETGFTQDTGEKYFLDGIRELKGDKSIIFV